MNPFELALGVEAKQPMDLAIPKTKGIHRKGSKEAEKMAKAREERKSWTIKLLERRKQVKKNKPTSRKST